jgi:DNA-binding response OmpR family regulator
MFAQELGTEPIHVLLVEDSHREAVLAKKLLEGADAEFAIHRVATFKEAQQTALNTKVDVVVLDLGLPDSKGLDTISTFTHLFPLLPVVVLSGCSDVVSVIRALEQGAQEFLLKGECSGKVMRQAILNSIFRKSMEKEREET